MPLITAILVGIVVVGFIKFITEEQKEEVKPLTDKDKDLIALHILTGKTDSKTEAQNHNVPVEEVEKWVDDFVAGSENFITKKTDLHAKIGELEMEIKWFEHTCQKFIGDDWKEKTEYDKRK
ncbi:MAG: hypothetical protein IKQ90_06095 [Ruminococcus sp.]|nr:hypothetical protein [Ruminococcus sp.]